MQPNAADLYSFDEDFTQLKKEILESHKPEALRDLVKSICRVVRNTHVVTMDSPAEVVPTAPTTIIRTRNKKLSQAKMAGKRGRRKRTRDPIGAELAEEEMKLAKAKGKQKALRHQPTKPKATPRHQSNRSLGYLAEESDKEPKFPGSSTEESGGHEGDSQSEAEESDDPEGDSDVSAQHSDGDSAQHSDGADQGDALDVPEEDLGNHAPQVDDEEDQPLPQYPNPQHVMITHEEPFVSLSVLGIIIYIHLEVCI